MTGNSCCAGTFLHSPAKAANVTASQRRKCFSHHLRKEDVSMSEIALSYSK